VAEVEMRPGDLVAGNCYFTVGYTDGRFTIPLIQTLVYVGPEEDSETGQPIWMFNDVSSHRPTETPETPDETLLFVFPEDQLSTILDLAGLIRTLGEATPDHPLHPLPPDPGPASEGDLGQLQAHLKRFFESPTLAGVTITIRFTDDGLSLARRSDGGIDLLLFPHPRLEPDREAAMRSLCVTAGMGASQDYLSNYGRTRVLVYPVPPDGQPRILSLARRLFLEAYAMRKGDTLRFQFTDASDASPPT
jgi:hypothetical protein